MGLKKANKASAEFNMSSMTDIIFLLLIFFMLSSNAVSPNAINLKLPSTSKSAATPPSERKPIKLSVDKRKKYKINGNRITEGQVAPQLAKLIRQDGRDPKEITVTLDIDETVDAQTLVTNVDILNGLGVKMMLATKLSKK